MKKIVLLSILLLALGNRVSNSQWRVLQVFQPPQPFFLTNSVDITWIYFLDLPGSPRIGFLGMATQSNWDTTAGAGGQVWKTTDGGISWNQMEPAKDRTFFGQGVADITLKDSLIGWLAANQHFGSGSCYKTTDGGETWRPLPGTLGNARSLYYHAATDRLFLSYGDWTHSKCSTDEGNSWQDLGKYYAACVFADDSIGIFASGDTVPPTNVWEPPTAITTDGGRTWTPTTDSFYSLKPLAIKGTKTFLKLDYLNRLRRTDDGGSTWRVISTVSGRTEFNLFGDLKRLYTKSGSGVFESTDEGVSWHSLCGSFYGNASWGFYKRDKYIYSSEFHGGEAAKLWYLNLDSLHIFNSNVSSAFTDGSKINKVPVGDIASIVIKPVADSLAGIDSAHYVIRYDANSLSALSLNLPAGWVITDSSLHSGVLDVWLTDTSSQFSNPILRINFQTILTGLPSAKVYLDSSRLIGKWLNCDIGTQSVSGPDSVEIDLNLRCGDSTLLRHMATGSPFAIESVQPNPSSGEVNVHLSHATEANIEYSLFNALGQSVLHGSFLKQDLKLDVKDIPSGTYFLRLSSGEYTESRRIVKYSGF